LRIKSVNSAARSAAEALTTWFLTIHLNSQAKTVPSSLALEHPLGLSYPTAWLPAHEIDGAMAQATVSIARVGWCNSMMPTSAGSALAAGDGLV
jgi:hypothetical protein